MKAKGATIAETPNFAEITEMAVIASYAEIEKVRFFETFKNWFPWKKRWDF